VSAEYSHQISRYPPGAELHARPFGLVWHRLAMTSTSRTQMEPFGVTRLARAGRVGPFRFIDTARQRRNWAVTNDEFGGGAGCKRT
jgi:hypothetical protein